MELINKLVESSNNLKNSYQPLILRLSDPYDKQQLEQLIAANKVSFVHDEIQGQLKELVKLQHPSVRIAAADYEALILKHLNGITFDEYGVWVYYEWSRTLVHTLDEQEFVQVRTNRNQYKITLEEQETLRQKTIAVIGLSVGQSIALTLATERVCGTLRLADFDELELSNLNRIRAGIRNLGISKVVLAAREIAEIDPFIKVKIYPEGITKENIDDFLAGGHKADILVEVCDGLDVKINSRFKARAYGIPVIMDTNDRGMLDVERFDLEPERPILHGLADGLDPDNIKSLTNEEKIPFILKMIGVESISTRLKASMMEVEQSINTWPQLASSVVLGGAITTDVCRRVLLGQFHDSGRYYIDFDEMVANKMDDNNNHSLLPANPNTPLDHTVIAAATASFFRAAGQAYTPLSADETDQLIAAAIAAPSAGNNQPWKFASDKGVIFVFHDAFSSWSWGDYNHMGATMALGASVENINLQALKLNLAAQIMLCPTPDFPQLIAAIHFERNYDVQQLFPFLADLSRHLFERHTNRKLGSRQPVTREQIEGLKEIAETFEGIKFLYIDDEEAIKQLGSIIADCDKIRLLNEQGHKEFYEEVRWTPEEAERTRNGIELRAVDLSPSEIAGFAVGKDWQPMELVKSWGKGDALKKMSVKTVKSASAMILISCKAMDTQNLVTSGRAVERMWIYANQQHLSVHPMLSPVFFFNKLRHKDWNGFSEKNLTTLNLLKKEFNNIFDPQNELLDQYNEVFLLKIAVADDINVPSLRKRKEEVFINFA